MPDVERINEYLQSCLRNEARTEVTAVEAATWLDEKGLLSDSPSRPGFPLRELLRAGCIVGQEQRPAQAYGRWHIKRSA